MAEICHLENRRDVILFCWGWSNLDKILQTGVEWHVDCGDMVKLETRCRIPIWQTFGRIPWHVIPALQGAATWRIQCYDPRATCHITGCCHRRIQQHVIPEPRITLQGAATWWIHCHDCRATCHIAGCSHLAKSMSWSCHIAGCKNFIRHIENRFLPYFIYFLFLMHSLGFDERRLSYCLRYTCFILNTWQKILCSVCTCSDTTGWASDRVTDIKIST